MLFAKIVKFEDGMYGIRRNIFGFYFYFDFKEKNRTYWWRINSRWIRDCKVSESRARQVFYKPRIDYGIPIDSSKKDNVL